MQRVGHFLNGRRLGRRCLIGYLRCAALGGTEWGLELLRDEKAPNDQLVDFQSTDSGSANRQSTDGDGTDGNGTDREGAQHEATDCKGASCKRTDRSCAGVRALQWATEGVPGFHGNVLVARLEIVSARAGSAWRPRRCGAASPRSARAVGCGTDRPHT